MKNGILGILALLSSLIGLNSFADTLIIKATGKNITEVDGSTMSGSNGLDTGNGVVRGDKFVPRIIGLTTDGKVIELQSVQIIEETANQKLENR